MPDDSQISVSIGLTRDRPDWKALVAKCGTIHIGVPPNERDAIITALSPPRVPDWAVAYGLSYSNKPDQHQVYIHGVDRGVWIWASYYDHATGTDRTNDLVQIFNDQASKLEAA